LLTALSARQFNPPGDVTNMAANNEALYWKEWAKAVNARMTPDERKQMATLVNKALKDPLSIYFRVAVDPVALGIPQYFDIIPQEDARDLSLIKSKLEKSVYSTTRQVDEDVELMLENARVFNGAGEVVDLANSFGAWWKRQRAQMEA
jgi:transcription initiation factor TFIID subunit 2